MIKINLAKASASITVEAQPLASGGLANFSASDNVVKVVLMLVFVIGLYSYESYTISEKKSRFYVVNNEAGELKQQVTKFGPVTAVVEDLAKERVKLNKQMEVIEKISKKRAFKLSSILELQKAIPVDSWVEEISVKENLIKFNGFSRDPRSVQQIVAHLQNLEFVDIATNKELSMQKIGKSEIHTFKIEVRTR
ncbi:MAG: PilN domain-containing protein [Bdellovibrionales bacterium]|nr:PilN domain-containing protein [Bdellovibrionales bacterium]NQZ18143.1 PilN domain-containing protein [Bdellovibrionales bacterium]